MKALQCTKITNQHFSVTKQIWPKVFTFVLFIRVEQYAHAHVTGDTQTSSIVHR